VYILYAVSAGIAHRLAITTDGSVWSWGNGGRGKLGHGDQQHQLLPKKIEAFTGQRVVAVSAGSRHSIARIADGSVWSWGQGGWGRLGHGDEQSQLPKSQEALQRERGVEEQSETAAARAMSAGRERASTRSSVGRSSHRLSLGRD